MRSKPMLLVAALPFLAVSAQAPPRSPEAPMCSRIFAPVCGVDGRTYTNACEAQKARTAVASDGACGVVHTTPCTSSSPSGSGCGGSPVDTHHHVQPS